MILNDVAIPEETVSADNSARCLVTGHVLPADYLLRFAIDPQNRLVPDLRGNLPGKGVWVCDSRKAVEKAVSEGLFSEEAGMALEVDQALPDTVESLLRQQLLSFLGLVKRNGGIVTGFEKVKSALTYRQAIMVFEAQDAARNSRGKIAEVSESIACYEMFASKELSHALGTTHTVHAAVTHPEMAKNVERLAERLKRYTESFEITE